MREMGIATADDSDRISVESLSEAEITSTTDVVSPVKVRAEPPVGLSISIDGDDMDEPILISPRNGAMPDYAERVLGSSGGDIGSRSSSKSPSKIKQPKIYPMGLAQSLSTPTTPSNSSPMPSSTSSATQQQAAEESGRSPKADERELERSEIKIAQAGGSPEPSATRAPKSHRGAGNAVHDAGAGAAGGKPNRKIHVPTFKEAPSSPATVLSPSSNSPTKTPVWSKAATLSRSSSGLDLSHTSAIVRSHQVVLSNLTQSVDAALRMFQELRQMQASLPESMLSGADGAPSTLSAGIPLEQLNSLSVQYREELSKVSSLIASALEGDKVVEESVTFSAPTEIVADQVSPGTKQGTMSEAVAQEPVGARENMDPTRQETTTKSQTLARRVGATRRAAGPLTRVNNIIRAKTLQRNAAGVDPQARIELDEDTMERYADIIFSKVQNKLTKQGLVPE